MPSSAEPPAPPAWAMMPPSNALQLLDETFSVSGTESSATNSTENASGIHQDANCLSMDSD
ncbi:lysis system o-spanin lipoprotein Rz1 [Escherichia coli]|uniref:lysis system o-spanin lipoprotein Rz1 n=1 Tax=Escherichia coli TaxID=562 RepID=UPI003B285161